MDTRIHELFPKIDTINVYKKGKHNWYYLIDSTFIEAYRWIDLRNSRNEKFNYELQYLTRYNPHYYNSGNRQNFDNYFTPNFPYPNGDLPPINPFVLGSDLRS